MAKNIIVGCRLPNGLILRHPKTGAEVEIAGANKERIIGSGYALTEVDEEFYKEWLASHKDFAPIVSGAIVSGATEKDVSAALREVEKEETGFEGLSQDTADKDNMANKANKVA